MTILARIRSLSRSLGATGLLALALAAAGAAFYVSVLVPAERELAATRLASASASAARLRPVALDPRSEDLRRFHALLPPAEGLADELEKLFALARAAGLEPVQGEYRAERQRAGLIAYRVVLPVRGSYAQVRRFIGQLLAGMPAASLDALRLERKKAADAQLDAQLRLTLYFRPPEETP